MSFAVHKLSLFAGRCAVLGMFYIIFSGSAQAQDTTNADGLFESARWAAIHNKNFPEAIRLAKKAIAISPAYADIVVFAGQVYTWNNQPDSGRKYLQHALELQPKNEDAYSAYSDLEFWNKNLEPALVITQKGLDFFPSSQSLLLKKARILEVMKNYKAAIAVTDTLLTLNSADQDARALNTSLKRMASRNRIEAHFDFAHFDKEFMDDWYFGSVEYTRVTGLGPVVARVNYGNRFKQGGLLYEVDAYPRISHTFYMYLNGGYADNALAIFPKWRGGASLFANLPHAFEAEAGVRYLYYSSNIFFYTAYAGKYYKNFLFGVRTYLNPSANGISNASMVTMRYYYGEADDYVNLTLGAGISPDNRELNVVTNNLGNQQSYTGELLYRRAIDKLNIVSFNVSLVKLEYLPGMVGNQVQAGVGYVRYF